MNFEEIYRFADMSLTVYGSDADIRDHYGERNLVAVQPLPKTDGKFIVLKDATSKALEIAARGTANFENVLIDAEYSKRSDSKLGIYVHRGFDEAAQELYASVRPYLRTYQDKGYSFRLTGHSLGGAMAAILALLLLADGYEVDKTITFGQPKLTNKEGVKKYREIPLLRIIDERDLVPLLPPLTLVSSMHGKYRHFGQEIVLLRDEYYARLSERASESPEVSSFWHNLGNEQLADHHIAKYIERLEPKLKKAQQVAFEDRLKYE
jgi:hypothetical protein